MMPREATYIDARVRAASRGAPGSVLLRHVVLLAALDERTKDNATDVAGADDSDLFP
jgi:hypothetical protein